MASSASAPTSRIGTKLSTQVPQLTANVAQHGYDAEGYAASNMKKFGATCPREHFICGPCDLTTYQVSQIWGLEYRTVQRWAKEDKWVELREERLKHTPIEQGGYLETESIAVLKERVTAQQANDLQEAIRITMARLAEEEEEAVTPLGDTVRVKKKAASHKAEVNALTELYQELRVVVGLPTKHTGAFAGATINNNQGTINRILIIDDSKQAEAAQSTLALPEVGGTAVEGEVCP